MSAPYPVVIPEAFAQAADPSRRNVIPDTTVNPQRASFSLGFPPQTMTPIIAGGKPMLGPDMNGILYMMSSHTFYQQTGQPYRWNADVVAALVTGYAAGTLLGSTDGTTLWLSITNNNTSDPDAGGAGWVPMFSYGITTLPPTTGGIVTLTTEQAKRSVIVLSGALVANLQLVFPTSLRRWLVVNTTTGGFTTTAKTAAGAGVNIPQGGFSAPVEVYGDGISLYPVVAPVNLPIDVAPTPNTIVQRSNNGYVFATYLNQNSPLENFSINEIFAGSGDGYLRKINRTNFAANFLLSWFAGQVVDAQVPASAVDQHRAVILANSALTGTPTAPTPAVGDNSTKVATTAFVQGTAVIAGTGYMRFPNGLIIQWGHQVQGGGIGNMNVIFPIAFPTAFFMGLCCTGNRNFGGSNGSGYVTPVSNAAMSVFVDGSNVGNRDAYWLAIGN